MVLLGGLHGPLHSGHLRAKAQRTEPGLHASDSTNEHCHVAQDLCCGRRCRSCRRLFTGWQMSGSCIGDVDSVSRNRLLLFSMTRCSIVSWSLVRVGSSSSLSPSISIQSTAPFLAHSMAPRKCLAASRYISSRRRRFACFLESSVALSEQSFATFHRWSSVDVLPLASVSCFRRSLFWILEYSYRVSGRHRHTRVDSHLPK